MSPPGDRTARVSQQAAIKPALTLFPILSYPLLLSRSLQCVGDVYGDG